MITEDQARELLTRAGGTIEVEESAPMTLTGLPEPRVHARWLVPALVAAVVVLIAGGVVLADRVGGDHTPDPVGTPTTTVVPDPAPTRTTVPPVASLPPDPVREATARAFIQWARTGQAPPKFAARVRQLYPHALARGPFWTTEPAEREHWSGCSGLGFPGCGLDPVAAIYNSRWRQPTATVPELCTMAADDDEPIPGPRADVVRIGTGDGGLCSGTTTLWIDASGAIYAVGLGGFGAPSAPSTPAGTVSMPGLIGYTETEARALLEANGLRVRVEEQMGCDYSNLVISTEPSPGVDVPPGHEVVVTVARGWVNALCKVARYPQQWEFLRFARGLGPAPAMADQVMIQASQLGKERIVWRTLTDTEAADPLDWRLQVEGDEVSALQVLDQLASSNPSSFADLQLLSTPLQTAPSCIDAAIRSAVHWNATIWPADGADDDRCPDTFVGLAWDDTGALTNVRVQVAAP